MMRAEDFITGAHGDTSAQNAIATIMRATIRIYADCVVK